MTAALERVRREGFTALDLELAGLLARLSPADAPAVGLGAALAAAWRRDGHLCLPLDESAGLELGRGCGEWGARTPDLEEWRRALQASPLVGAGAPGEAGVALVLDGADRLYLQRLHAAEGEAATRLRGMLEPLPLPEGLAARLEELVGAGDLDPGQRQAILVAFARGLAVVTGGPGTGKTRTLGQLLALALAARPGLRLRLAAPTGKAAARLHEALADVMARMPEASRSAVAALPRPVTLHRLLLERPEVDWLVVDEASMVDLPLLVRVLAILPPAARLLLAGDADQLASVEAGAVLASLVDGLDALALEPRPVAQLTRSWRFRAGGGIGALAAAVRGGDADTCARLLEEGGPELGWIRPGEAGWSRGLAECLEEGMAPFRDAPDAATALAALDGFRVVCGLRRGRLGVEGLNAWCDARWRRPGPDSRAPLLVRANDPLLGLANGDSGVLEGEAEAPGATAWLAPGGAARSFAVAQLPAFDRAWAITVHQAQGSEADEVLLVLPAASSPLLCRELLYTGLTRARRRLVLVATPEALRTAVLHRARRRGALAERLASGA